MPLAQSSTDARRCLSTVALCAITSIYSQDTLPRDATSPSSMLDRGRWTTGSMRQPFLFKMHGFCSPLSGIGNLPGLFHTLIISAFECGTTGQLLLCEALSLQSWLWLDLLPSVWLQQRSLVNDVVNTVSLWGECIWVSSMFVLSSCPQGFVGSTLVIAFVTLVKMSQRSSPIFSFMSQPHLSQSEFGRCPDLMQAFFICLQKDKQNQRHTLLLYVEMTCAFPSEPQAHTVEGQSSQLKEFNCSAELRVWMPCVCNLVIFAHRSSKDLLIVVLSLNFVTEMSLAESVSSLIFAHGSCKDLLIGGSLSELYY